MMDLHGLPGSQNGNDHSGVVGPIGWATNSSNIDRSLQALAAMTVEVTKPEYQGVVKAIEGEAATAEDGKVVRALTLLDSDQRALAGYHGRQRRLHL